MIEVNFTSKNGTKGYADIEEIHILKGRQPSARGAIGSSNPEDMKNKYFMSVRYSIYDAAENGKRVAVAEMNQEYDPATAASIMSHAEAKMSENIETIEKTKENKT